MSWLKSFTLSLEVISAAVEALYQLGCSEDVKQTQVGERTHAVTFHRPPHGGQNIL